MFLSGHRVVDWASWANLKAVDEQPVEPHLRSVGHLSNRMRENRLPSTFPCENIRSTFS